MTKANMKNPEVIMINLTGVADLSREKQRWAIEKAISNYTNNDKVPHLKFDEYGKPYLTGQGNLTFSYSHSKTMLTLVVSTSASAVGIDTENSHRLNDIAEISDYAFSREELDSIMREDMLFWWCLKEASIKQLGSGFRDADPSEFTIKIIDNTYTLYLSGNIILSGFFKKRYFGDDLIVICSNIELENLVFSASKFDTGTTATEESL